MNPRTEKMTNPATKLVPLFSALIQKTSLEEETGADRHCAFIGGHQEMLMLVCYCCLLITVVAVLIVAAHDN